MPDVALGFLPSAFCATAPAQGVRPSCQCRFRRSFCKQDDRLPAQVITLKERIDNRRRSVPPRLGSPQRCIVVASCCPFTAIFRSVKPGIVSIVLRAFFSIQFRSASSSQRRLRLNLKMSAPVPQPASPATFAVAGRRKISLQVSAACLTSFLKSTEICIWSGQIPGNCRFQIRITPPIQTRQGQG